MGVRQQSGRQNDEGKKSVRAQVQVAAVGVRLSARADVGMERELLRSDGVRVVKTECGVGVGVGGCTIGARTDGRS